MLVATALLTACQSKPETTASEASVSAHLEVPSAPPLQVDSAVPAPTAGGAQRFIRVAGTERRYLLHVPEGHDATKSAPLLLFFHDGGGTAEQLAVARELQIVRRAAKYGFVLAFPEGTAAETERGGGFTFNAGHCCGSALARGIDDVGFVRALIAELVAESGVDSRRVYVMGFGNGAMLCHRVAAELSDQIAAAIPIAGTIGGKADEGAPVWRVAKPQAPVAVMAIHGRTDDQVRYDGGRTASLDGGERLGRVDASSADSMNLWRVANGCGDRSKVEKHGRWTRESWSDCKDGTTVAIISGEDMGHSIPERVAGMRIMQLATTFFLQHRRP